MLPRKEKKNNLKNSGTSFEEIVDTNIRQAGAVINDLQVEEIHVGHEPTWPGHLFQEDKQVIGKY